MDVLLVWEGEQVDLYHIPNAPDWVLLCHGYYINSSAMSSEIEGYMMRLCDALSDSPDYCDNPDDEFACEWAQYLIGADGRPQVVDGPVHVVVTGFVP